MTTFKAWLTAFVAVLATLAFSASPAFAESHPKIGEFGSFSNPNGIAVDESTGDVYVADIGTQTVYKFDASGHAVNFTAGTGVGTDALTGIPAQSQPAESFSFPTCMAPRPRSRSITRNPRRTPRPVTCT